MSPGPFLRGDIRVVLVCTSLDLFERRKNDPAVKIVTEAKPKDLSNVLGAVRAI